MLSFWKRWKATRTVLFVSVEENVMERITELEAANAALLAEASVTERDHLAEIEQLLGRVARLEATNKAWQTNAETSVLGAENAKWAERLRYVIEVWEVDADGRFEYTAPGVAWPEQLDVYMTKYPQAWQKGEVK